LINGGKILRLLSQGEQTPRRFGTEEKDSPCPFGGEGAKKRGDLGSVHHSRVLLLRDRDLMRSAAQQNPELGNMTSALASKGKRGN